MPHTPTHEDPFAKYGAVFEPEETEAPPGSYESLREEFNPAPPQEDDPFARFGAVDEAAEIVPTSASAPEPLEPSDADPTLPGVQKAEREALSATRAALIQEGRWIRDKLAPDDPRRPRLEKSFVDRWVEQGFQEREEELGSRITFGATPVKDTAFKNQVQGLRRLEETAYRWAGIAQAGTLRALGKEEEALSLTRALNDFQEYNNILDRDSALGKKYGPLFGQIGSSLGVSTLSAGTGGVAGVAGMFGIESFSQGIEAAEAQGLSGKEQLQHAAIQSAITVGTTMVGGKLAERAGVSSGDSVVPFFGKAATELFTKTGLTKAAVAAGFEAGEEGVQTLLSSLEEVRAGVDENATDNLFDKVLTSASTGALVGTVAQLGSFAGQYDLKTGHYKKLMMGWAKRVKDNPVPAPKMQEAQQSKYVQDEQGRPLEKSVVAAELHVLNQLEQEIDAQFEKGGDAELKQVIFERTEDFNLANKEIAELNTRIENTPSKATRSRLKKRRAEVAKYASKIAQRLKADKASLESWKTEFESINKSEKEYIAEEKKRLQKQQKLEAAKGPPPETQTTPDGTVLPADGPIEVTDPVADPEKVTSPEGPNKFDRFKESLTRGRQEDVKKVREFLDLDKLPARESQSTEVAFELAQEQGLAEKALDMANMVLSTGRMLDNVQLAGLQLRYVDLASNLASNMEFLANNPNVGPEIVDAREATIQKASDEIDRLGEAWLRSSSETGAALQAQKRVLGLMYSPQRLMQKARKNKQDNLSVKEKDEVSRQAAAVEKAQKDLEDTRKEFDKGTDEFDRAEMHLASVTLEANAFIENFKPGGRWLDALDTVNGIGSFLTLSGDLIPFGRQGFATVSSNPIKMMRNLGSFFKPLMNLKVEDARLEAFRVERSIREMDNFRALSVDYGVPLMSQTTSYNQVEGSLAGRISQAIERLPGGKKLGLRNVPGVQFELAYRSWLNKTRFDMANLAFEQNKTLLDQEGGQAEMQTIIDNVMTMTGHNKGGLGEVGRVALIAPRWFLSRIAMPFKAGYHIPRGAWSAMTGQKNASRHISRQYARTIAGATVLSAAAEGLAGLLFGSENVSMERDPFNSDFGLLRVNDRVYDMTGGTGFVYRTLNKFRKGAIEAALGPDKERDADAGQILGSTLVGRFSPIARHSVAVLQSGVPIFEDEKLPMMEYALRNATFLSYQDIYDAAKDEGITHAFFESPMSLFGFGGRSVK